MRRGITLIEILVLLVICVVALGGGLLLVARQRENALRLHCQNNLKDLVLAVRRYHDASSANEKQRTLPPARLAEGYATWAVLLMPHLSKEHALQRWDLEQSYFNQPEEVRMATYPKFFCPAHRRDDALSKSGDLDVVGTHQRGALGSYGSVAGDGSAPWNGAILPAIIDQRDGERILKWQSRTGLDSLVRGQENTMLLGEKHLVAEHAGDARFGDGSLYNGGNPDSFARSAGPGFPLASVEAAYNKQFGSWHHRICYFAFADGGVRPLAMAMDEQLLGRLARRELD